MAILNQVSAAAGTILDQGAGTVWTGDNDAKTENDTGAQCAVLSGNSRLLRMQGRGFTLPLDAKVMGIEVLVRFQVTSGTTGTAHFNAITLNEAVLGGAPDNNAPATVFDETQPWTDIVLGNDRDRWGWSSLQITPAIVNSATFRCDVRITHDANAPIFHIDYSRITVWFREAVLAGPRASADFLRNARRAA